LRKKYKDIKFLNIKFKKKIVNSYSKNIFHWLKFFLKKYIFVNKLLSVGYLNKHHSYFQKLDGDIMINSIFDYCDFIYSSKGIITTHHGQSHLSSAIKKQYNKKLKSICIIPRKYYDVHKREGMFVFDNVEYKII